MTAAPRPERGPGNGSGSRYVPVALCLLAFAVVAAALPTTLRPPPERADTAAEFSPDAPPDDEQEAIVAALQRGTSGTAGAGTGETRGGGGSPPPPPPDAVVAPPAIAPARSCPGGFGDPPRQVESVYSAPCAPAWQGDNGGATYQGVTATEVRVAWVGPSGNNANGQESYNGEATPSEPQEDESSWDRTMRVYQTYFNQNFQFWGRRLQLYALRAEGDSPEEQIAGVARADEEFKVFAGISEYAPGLKELARRGLVGLGGMQLQGDLYGDRQPYLWTWDMDGSRLMGLHSEYICQQLAGRNAEFAGDPLMQAEPRKFGVLVFESPGFTDTAGDEVAGNVKRQCGVDVTTIVYDAYSADGGSQANFNTAISRLKFDGVTTVLLANDLISTSPLLHAANGQAYRPEWIVGGMWLMDVNFIPKLFGYPQDQWRHAFGLTSRQMQRPFNQTEWWRAYKEVDPSGQPDFSDPTFYYLLQIANGIQMAGPHLTPETFRQGLNALGTRPSDPVWSIGGGYGPGDNSYGDDVAEIWWDPAAPDPTGFSAVGAYRYARCGARWAPGSIPAGPPQVFKPGDPSSADEPCRS